MTLALSIGKWGGVYLHYGYTARLCLGWITVTFIPRDLDELLQEALSEAKESE